MAVQPRTELVKSIYLSHPATYDCMPEMALNVGLGNSEVGFPATLSCVAYYVEMQSRPVKHKMPSDIPYMVTFAPTIGILKHGENPKWAERAFDYGISEDWESKVESFGGKIPARKGVSASSTVPADCKYFPTLEHARKISETRDAILHIKAALEGSEPVHVTPARR